jgi:predicted nucleotidyltransferase
MVKISPPAVSKAIVQLEKEKLIFINKNFLLEIRANFESEEFRNFKRIFNLSQIYSSGLYVFLKDNFPLSSCTLFGSYSLGEDSEKSDVDICIEGSEKILDLEKYEKKLNRKINLEFINFKKMSEEFRDNIINGIVLFGYVKI